VREEQPHPDQIVLRCANEADLPAIVALEHLSFPLAGERFDERRVRRVTSDSRFVVTVAEQNGQVLGWVAGFARSREAFRGAGFMRSLLTHGHADGN